MSLFIIDFVQADVAVCLVSLYKLMLLFTSELVQADVAVHPRAPIWPVVMTSLGQQGPNHGEGRKLTKFS